VIVLLQAISEFGILTLMLVQITNLIIAQLVHSHTLPGGPRIVLLDTGWF